MSEIPATKEAEEAGASAYERWADAARPKARVWRLVLGLALIWVVSQLVVVVVGVAYMTISAIAQGGANPLNPAIDEFTGATTVPATLAVLASFGGLWIGAWIALRVLHGGQRLSTLFSPERKLRWKEFGIGVGIIVAYLLAGVALSYVLGLGDTGRRNDIPIETWLLAIAPMLVAVFIQACGEEVAFRGYAMQQLQARFSNIWIAAFAPSIVFGAVHYANGSFAEYSWYYVADTLLFGLVAAVTVWRTGSIAIAMGMHFANNFAGFMIAGPDDFATATPLYLDSVQNLMKSAPLGIALMVGLLAFVLSPWAPMPKGQWPARRPARRNETRAAP